jgi:type I restriction enzyme S subunit
LRAKSTLERSINYVDLSSTKWGRIEAVTTYPAHDAPSRAQRVLRPGDTIVGTVRPGNGSYALVAQEDLIGSTGFAVLRPAAKTYAPYVYLAATASENIEALSRLADGGAYPAVRPDAVTATAIVRPNHEVLSAFSRVVGPLLEKSARNERQSRTVANLRDSLLPRLISGEAPVSGASAPNQGVDA